jgi:hypothetical protein
MLFLVFVLFKMLEISACVELKAKSEEVIETNDHEFGDISFEELLAQEKKDAFWLVAKFIAQFFFYVGFDTAL